MRPGTTGRGSSLCPRSSCTMHCVAAAACTSICITTNIVRMTACTVGRGRTSGKRMCMAWHLAGSQCDGRCSACFLHRIKVAIRCVNSYRHPATAPRYPSTSKINSGIGRSDTHIDTAYRIHRFGKLLDVFFQEHPIDFYIPVLGHLKGIITFRYLSNRHTFAAIFKVHDHSTRGDHLLYGNGGKRILHAATHVTVEHRTAL